jgi:predicted dehydrogenase
MSKITRRRLLKTVAAVATAPAMFHIVPRHCVAQSGQTPPSETLGAAIIGRGGQSGGTFSQASKGHTVKLLAECDVKFVGKADDKYWYTDFRKVLERKDIDVVAIATPPHWHALITIAAMEAGKDVLCEKPMTRTIAEGRAVVEAERRYGRIFQVGTFGRFGSSQDRNKVLQHKIMRSGLLKECKAVHVKRGGLKVKEWSGKPHARVQKPPGNLDWDMYCGPSPLKPFVNERFGGSHRKYWDYEGGGLSDMGQHHFDPTQWEFGKDDTSPVSIEAYAPPPHPECTGMWGWVEMVFADGLTYVLESTEWGEPYDRRKGPANVTLADLSPEDQEKIKAMPDPAPLLSFAEAVKQRKPAGGHAEAAHRAACIVNLANIAIRVGRKLRYDPVKEVFIGDEEANRLVNQPMRAPWHL